MSDFRHCLKSLVFPFFLCCASELWQITVQGCFLHDQCLWLHASDRLCHSWLWQHIADCKAMCAVVTVAEAVVNIVLNFSDCLNTAGASQGTGFQRCHCPFSAFGVQLEKSLSDRWYELELFMRALDPTMSMGRESIHGPRVMGITPVLWQLGTALWSYKGVTADWNKTRNNWGHQNWIPWLVLLTWKPASLWLPFDWVIHALCKWRSNSCFTGAPLLPWEAVSRASTHTIPCSSLSQLRELTACDSSVSPLELLLPGMTLHAVCVEIGRVNNYKWSISSSVRYHPSLDAAKWAW